MNDERERVTVFFNQHLEDYLKLFSIAYEKYELINVNTQLNLQEAVNIAYQNALVDAKNENAKIEIISNKLKSVPRFNIVSTKGSENRIQYIQGNIEKYSLSNRTKHYIFERYVKGTYNLHWGNLNPDHWSDFVIGCFTSHMLILKDWYENTDEPYTVVFEDDVSFDPVFYWNFDWQEFINFLPGNWQCVQLCRVREWFNRFSVGIRNRCWCDWSSAAYVVSRNHVKNLLEHYVLENGFNMKYAGEDKDRRAEWTIIPTADVLLYTSFGHGGVYSIPLFSENVHEVSTTAGSVFALENNYNPSNTQQGLNHEKCYLETMHWWKTIGQYQKLQDISEI